ncbi:myb/SANT-like DNA-binding domain-containing protein 3 isoform X2 [Hyla sarda]|uniref:myb/SANT-like DNA-binding domain-containing protein 3 isoform X2 n=1 Tax=Hyla sarda TaxID=327740 RepID=UPI0024C39EE1|nr:myb/SANT-like DNA-binding domain-containing protein 3 isoform X2 [Hyla sarda]
MLGVVVLQQLEVRHPMMESWLHLAPNVDNQKLLNQMFAVPWKMQNNEVLKPAKYFSELEKNVLLALVEKYKYVLECKKSDARTIALKQRTWQALAHEYNSQPSVSLRDFKQLKKCWENIKARTRKIMAHERREKVMRCGLASNSLKEKVASMIPEQIYYVQTQSEEESQYNHDSSNPDMDCKKVNLLDLELLIDEQGKIQTKPYNKAPETDLLCGDGSPSSSVEKAFHKGDLEILIDEQGKIQTEPIRNVSVTDSVCAEGASPNSIKKESFVIPDRDMYSPEKSNIVNMQKCQDNLASPSCSTPRITANRTYRSKPTQNGILTKMHEEEHHQQMSILQLQLIQMNEVHVAKVQQIERECEMAEVEHRIKMEILNKKKMYWERKLQTITKEWPVASFNRPFPNSP